MLDVAIGLILVFLLASLVCTALSELIEGFLKKRSSDLFTGIKELLQDKDGTGLAERVYKHPLIYSLYRKEYNARSSRNLPSYIPSRNFAMAMLDIFPMDSFKEEAPTAQDGNAGVIDKVKTESIEEVRKALSALIKTAQGDVSKAVDNIEAWYNSSMDRVSGWYKRRIQRMLLFLGLVVSVFLNLDTIAILKSLSDDPALRNSLVAAAQEYAKPGAVSDTINDSPQARIEKNSQKLRELRLPIGWDWERPDAELQKDPNYVTNYFLVKPSTPRGIFQKIVGLLITAISISLGSSFWFDALNRVAVIRSTVKPQEKSKDESSEDRQKT
jgi:hypothetical protein